MTEIELIAGLESGSLAAEQFTHAEHVRAAWFCLREAPLPAALERFSRTIRGFAAAKGVPSKYHETMTVAYMLVVAERLESARDASWASFAESNPDLLTHSPSVLATYYSEGLLSSERARRGFVMPDRVVRSSASAQSR